MEEIRQRWFCAVREYAPLYKEGDFLLLLDRYFLTVPALEKLRGLNSSGAARMEIITKAKKSCTAFERPGARKPGRGRPRKKGDAVHLKELFVSRKGQFQEAKVELYGKQETVRYYSIDLLWGQKLYQELRFVLVEMGGCQSILASTSRELEPLEIIRLYSYRFRIECTFRELKQQTGAFCYHFWSKHMPKLNYYQKKGDPAPLERVSEGALMYYLRKHFFRLMGQKPELCITRIIQEKQNKSEIPLDSLDSLAS